jgi:hypothetical protein
MPHRLPVVGLMRMPVKVPAGEFLQLFKFQVFDLTDVNRRPT